MRGITRLFAGGLALLTAFAVLGDAGPEREAAASPRYRVRTQQVAPGLKLHRIRDSRGPKAIRVVEMAPGTQLALDVALAREKIPWYEPTSAMANRRGAIAAINGDYTLGRNHAAPGRPVHAFAQDTRMVATELAWGRNLGIGENKRIAALGRARNRGMLSHPGRETPWRVHRWNDELLGNQVAAYTPEGKAAYKPPQDACSMRLLPQGEPEWSEDGLTVEQGHIVDRVACRWRRLARQGGTVVATARGTNKGNQFKQQVNAGDEVTLGWTMGWEGVVEAIGGNPTLIENGELVARCQDSSFCKLHPRTGVGIRPNGTILLVTVDGRRKNSVGIKPWGFAKLFRWLGADWALNLDGGGSTTMWVQGKVVNIPSNQGKERPVGSALLVLPRPDPGEPVVRPHGSSSSGSDDPDPLIEMRRALGLEPSEGAFGAPPAASSATTCRILSDSASTGGLLDALARGSFEGGRRGLGRVPAGLPDRLRDALDVFRGRTPCTNYLSSSGGL